MKSRKKHLTQLCYIVFIFWLNLNTGLCQAIIYNFQQVDSLATLKECPTIGKTGVNDWITCFYPKVQELTANSIDAMSQQVGMTF